MTTAFRAMCHCLKMSVHLFSSFAAVELGGCTVGAFEEC